MTLPHSLIDPAFMEQWALFEKTFRSGIRFVDQLQPHDAMDPPVVAPPNHHAVPTLVLCLSGSVTVEAKRDLTLMPGELVLIEPGVWHVHQALKPGDTSLGIGFFGDRCDVYFSSHDSSMWGWIAEDPYVHLVERLMFASDSAERSDLIGAIFSSLLQERIYSFEFTTTDVWNMVNCLWSHAYEPTHQVDDLVARAGVGRSKIFRLFRGVFGRSPKQEVLANRVSIAHHLIHRGASVAEAARRTGFTCRSDLTRAYRRIHGRPPTNRRPTMLKIGEEALPRTLAGEQVSIGARG